MDSPHDELALYERAIEGLELCIGELHDQAVRVADEYMKFVDSVEAKSTGWESRSALQLSCTKKGNHLDLKWTGIKWFGPRNARTSLRMKIQRNAETLAYTQDKLKLYAKEWEISSVLAAEEKLQVIRRKGKHIVKAIISVRNAIKMAKARGGSLPEESDETSVQDD